MNGAGAPLFVRVAAIGVDSLPAVDAIMQRAFDPRYGEAWNKAQCLSALALPGYRLIGAFTDSDDADAVRGFAITRSVAMESELLLLAADPAWQGRGVGTALMRNWVGHCQANGIERAFLEMRHDNAALHLYSRFDFQQIAIRRDYYRGGDGKSRDAITMQKYIG